MRIPLVNLTCCMLKYLSVPFDDENEFELECRRLNIDLKRYPLSPPFCTIYENTLNTDDLLFLSLKFNIKVS